MSVVAHASEIADTVTKESYDETKALADERGAKLAAAEAKLELFESRDRTKLKGMQPIMESLVKELTTEYATAETKGHFDSFADWTRTAHERSNIDTQMQLGTVIHACASKLKRTREDASVASATSEQLAVASKELEVVKENLAVKESRIGELSASLKEITENSEKLQLQLEKAGALQEKFDFSKTTSREEDAASKDVSLVTKTVENASKMQPISAFNPVEALSSLVNNYASGVNGRFTPTSGNHSLLGSSIGSNAESFNFNIRPM